MNIGRGSYNVVKRRESSELFDVLESGETSATGKIRCLRSSQLGNFNAKLLRRVCAVL